jgi:hypothetical protein
LDELDEDGILEDLLQDETEFDKADVMETLQNHSDPANRLIPRLVRTIGEDGNQLSLITGSGRVYPFLRTHALLESLQPALLHHPIVIFFPGEYLQDSNGGSHLRLFGSMPAQKITNPHYRATNLDYYRL